MDQCTCKQARFYSFRSDTKRSKAPAGWASGQPPRLTGNLASWCIWIWRCLSWSCTQLIIAQIPISFLFPRKVAARLQQLLSATRSAAASTANLLCKNSLPLPNQPRTLCFISKLFFLCFASSSRVLSSLPTCLSCLSPPGLLVSSAEHKVPKLAPDQSNLHIHLQESLLISKVAGLTILPSCHSLVLALCP